MIQVFLAHNKKAVRKTKKIGDRAYIFTSWGIVKGVIVKDRIDKNTGIPQYKFNIDIDVNNKNIEYGFWYTSDQMSKTKFTAVLFELLRPLGIKVINETTV